MGGAASACRVQRTQRGLFGGCGLESWWLRRWAASSDRWAGRGLQGTAQANRGGSKGAETSVFQQSSRGVAAASPRGSEFSAARQGRASDRDREGGRNGTMQDRKVWVWEGEVWWKEQRGALAKSDITHGQARWDWCCGLDPEPLSSTATTAGLSWFGCARTPSTCSAVSHTCTATVVRDSVPRSRSLWMPGVLAVLAVLCGAPALCSTRAFPAAPVSPPHACCETALCL